MRYLGCRGWSKEISKPGTLGVSGHCGLNLKGEFESSAALAGGDMRLPARADGLEERFNLKTERLTGSNLGLGE